MHSIRGNLGKWQRAYCCSQRTPSQLERLAGGVCLRCNKQRRSAQADKRADDAAHLHAQLLSGTLCAALALVADVGQLVECGAADVVANLRSKQDAASIQ